MADNIYQVLAIQQNGPTHVAFAKGDPLHIREYYRDTPCYQLEIKRVVPITITKEAVDELNALKKEKKELEDRLGTIKEKLKGISP